MSNNYKPTKWLGGKTIGTAQVMNNIEQGISNAHDRLDDIDSQIKEIATCKRIGLVSNSEIDAVENYNKLTNAILNNKTIYVDDVYYVSSDNIAEIETLTMIGISENAKIIFIDCTELWSIKYNTKSNRISIKNVDIENLNTSQITILKGDKFFINKFEVSNCNFDGQIRICNFCLAYDGKEDNNVGFCDVIIHNNRFSNCSGYYHVFILHNCMHDLISLQNNTITNLNKVWFYSSLDNDLVNREFFISKCKKLIAVNNILINDENFWCFDTPDVYYGMIVYKGTSAEYRMNHVEGLKLDFNKAMYDAYLGSYEVIYEDNTYKNNINLNPNIIDSCPSLYKAKLANKKSICRRNNFIVDYNWALQKAGEKNLNLDNTSYKLFDFDVDCEDFIYENNIVRVFDLNLTQGKSFKNVKIFNNDILCKKMNGSLLYCIAKHELNEIDISYNKIVCTDIVTSGVAGGIVKNFSILYMTKYLQENVNIKKIRISNNYISAFNINRTIKAEGVTNEYLTLIIDELDFSKNTIIRNDNINDNSKFYLLDWARSGSNKTGYTINKLIYKDNEISSKLIKGVQVPIIYPNMSYELNGDFDYYRLLIPNSDFLLDNIGNKSYTTTIKIITSCADRIFDTSICKFSTYYSRSLNRNILSFKNINDVNVYAALLKKDDVEYENNNNTKVKISKIDGTPSSDTILFYNSKNNAPYPELYLSIAGNGQTKNIKIDINTTVSDIE